MVQKCLKAFNARLIQKYLNPLQKRFRKEMLDNVAEVTRRRFMNMTANLSNTLADGAAK